MTASIHRLPSSERAPKTPDPLDPIDAEFRQHVRRDGDQWIVSVRSKDDRDKRVDLPFDGTQRGMLAVARDYRLHHGPVDTSDPWA